MRGVWGGGGAGRRASGHPEAQTSSPSARPQQGALHTAPQLVKNLASVCPFCSLLPPDPAWSPDFLTCEVGPLPTAN